MESSVLTKRNFIILLVMVVLALAIPIAINLLQRQTQLKSRASEVAGDSTIKFGTGVDCNSAGICTITSNKVDLQIKSPWPMSTTPTPTTTQ